MSETGVLKPPEQILVMGIGNLLMGDEGVGIHVVKHLEEDYDLPGIELVDGGTGGFHLMDYFQRYPRVILVDATMDGQPPGTIARLEPKFSSDYPPTLTAHDIGLKDLLDALQLLDKHPRVTLFTITIEDLSALQMELSPEIAAAVPRAAEEIAAYLKNPH